MRALHAVSAVGFVLLISTVASAATFIWDGAPDGGGTSANTLVTTGSNWQGDIAPSLSSPGQDWVFGPEGGANTTVTTPTTGGRATSITFSPGAPSYTISGTTGNNDVAFPSITNSSSSVQNINVAANLQGVNVKTPGAGLAFGGGYIYDNSSTDANSVRWWVTNDVLVNAPLWRNGTHNIYGANGRDTLTSDTAGTITLNAATGTTNTNADGNYVGLVNVWSGALRVTNANALGAFGTTGTRTWVHGTFNTQNTTIGQVKDGFDYGFGRLELANNIALNESVRIDSRIGDLADYDHIVNVSGDNSVGSTTANTGIVAMGGAGHFNFNSLTGGKLSFNAATNLHVSDGPRGNSSSGINSVFTFRGGGDFEVKGKLTQESGMSGTMAGKEGTVVTSLRKQGSGKLTFSGTGNDWDGGTLIEGGTVEVAATGNFSTGGSRIHVGGEATLDLSAIGGIAMVAGKTLSGAGTVKGNVITNDPTAVIGPGGAGGFDGNDAITVAAGAGTLTLQNDLDMSSAGSMQWNLAALSTSTPGTNFDQIVVGGNLVLGGSSNLTLDFSLLSGTGPGSGNPFWASAHSWKIIDTVGDNASTNFATITNGTFGSASFTTSISGGDIFLNYSAGATGDFDGDGDVDGADFIAWQTNFPTGSGASPSQGDADGDTDVDGADFAAWQTGFPTSPGSGASPVPEPHAFILLSIGGLIASAHRLSKN